MAAKATTIQDAVLIPSYVRQHKETAQRGKVIDQGGNKFSETTNEVERRPALSWWNRKTLGLTTRV